MFDMDKFCRLCLTEENVEIQLFADCHEDSIIPLYKKVMRCTSVQIQWGDGLPTLLCQTCRDNVNALWCFKESCEHVDTSLRKLINTNKGNANKNLEENIKLLAKKVSHSIEIQEKEKHTILPSSNKSGRYVLSSPVKTEASVKCEPDNDITSPPEVSPPSSPTQPEPNLFESLLNSEEDQSGTSPSNVRKNHRRTKEYICEFCGRKFPRANYLARHELSHVTEKPFHCSECDKSFWYKASLIGHIKQTHTGDVNYTCDLCGKGFHKKTELTRHIPTHSNETPHKCPQCGMGFKITKTLKRHIKYVHTAQRSYTCHMCGKSFIQAQTLKVHMILHSGVKPYVCSYCGKGFAQSAPLKTHIRTHTGEKPYSCHACGDSFTTRSALNSHTAKHSDTVMPYPCTRCSQSFRLKRDFVQHEQGHDDEEARLLRCEELELETEGSGSDNRLLDEAHSESSLANTNISTSPILSQESLPPEINQLISNCQ